ncbi:hypothetical protein D3C87_2057540 [compost metagenome]
MNLTQHLLIGKAQDRPTQRLDYFLPNVVIQYDLIQLVNPAIDLDHKAKGLAGEVDDEPIDGMLPPELQAIQPPVA